MAKSRSVKKEIRDELQKKVREGMSVKDAAERYGVSTASIYNWLGRKADGGKSEILELSRLKRENVALYQLVGRVTYQQNPQSPGGKAEIALSAMDEAEERGVSKSALALRLGVARSTLYYKPKRPELDEQLRLQIEAVMVENPDYGHRRVADALLMNRKRVRQVMKKFGLKPSRRASTPRKKEDRGLEPCSFPDILSRFSPIAPGVVWMLILPLSASVGRLCILRPCSSVSPERCSV